MSGMNGMRGIWDEISKIFITLSNFGKFQIFFQINILLFMENIFKKKIFTFEA